MMWADVLNLPVFLGLLGFLMETCHSLITSAIIKSRSVKSYILKNENNACTAVSNAQLDLMAKQEIRLLTILSIHLSGNDKMHHHLQVGHPIPLHLMEKNLLVWTNEVRIQVCIASIIQIQCFLNYKYLVYESHLLLFCSHLFVFCELLSLS